MHPEHPAIQAASTVSDRISRQFGCDEDSVINSRMAREPRLDEFAHSPHLIGSSREHPRWATRTIRRAAFRPELRTAVTLHPQCRVYRASEDSNSYVNLAVLAARSRLELCSHREPSAVARCSR